MKYKVIPLMYAASDNFKNTIRFALEFNDEINGESLFYAAQMVQKRYPYFSVKMEKEGEEFILKENDLPFVISDENKAVCLNSSESNYHILAFAHQGNVISVDISHNVCDGNGIAPLVKTLCYYYIQHRYGAEGIKTDTINLVSDPVQEDEYLYPFPDSPLPEQEGFKYAPEIRDPFIFTDDYFAPDGSYAYNLLVNQKELMKYAKPNDGSPVSFVCAMLYKTMMKLFPKTEKEIVFHIPHEYRKALGRPLSHDSLARVFDIKLSPKEKDYPLEMLNTMLRGQVILGSDVSGDIKSINGMVQLGGYLNTMPLEMKIQTMQAVVAPSIAAGKHTFGVSYTGNVDWCGMEKYIRNVHAYAGENKRSGGISVEIFTIGDNFSLCLMQPGKNPKFVNELIKTFKESGINCVLDGEEHFTMPDFALV